MLYIGAILRTKDEDGEPVEEFEGVEYVWAKDIDQARLMVWDKYKEGHPTARIANMLVLVRTF